MHLTLSSTPGLTPASDTNYIGDNVAITVNSGPILVGVGGNNDTIALGTSSSTVESNGPVTGTTITGGNGSNGIYGLGGGTTITLGDGDQTLALNGAGNQVTP